MRNLLIFTAALFFAACCPKTEKTPETATPAPQNETKMIRLNVFVTTTPENLAEVVEGLNTLAAASRAEAGCEGYEIYQSTIEPTRIYVKPVLSLLGEFPIHGIAHITGGGFHENLPRMLPEGLGIKIDLKSWTIPKLFQYIALTEGCPRVRLSAIERTRPLGRMVSLRFKMA